MEGTQLTADVERLAESLGQLPEPSAQPALVVVSGLPGTGKTYFCGKLAERLLFAILESDALRKVLFSPPNYSPKESSHLFLAVHRLIERLLTKGISLILDATNLSERHREYLYSITDRLDAKLVLVRIEAPPQVVRRRLENRLKGSNGKSDAGLGNIPEDEALNTENQPEALRCGHVSGYYPGSGQDCERN